MRLVSDKTLEIDLADVQYRQVGLKEIITV